jgi:hypothetical protein
VDCSLWFVFGSWCLINFQLIIDNWAIYFFAFGAFPTIVKFIVLFLQVILQKKWDQNLLFWLFGLSQAG